MKPSSSVYPIERIISALTYLTTGFVGFIWLIIAAFMKKAVRPFLMYHILQSIFISIAYFIIVELYKLIYIIFAKIPLINTLFFMLDNIINGSSSLLQGFSLFQVLVSLLYIYLIITSFLGMYSYIPFVSNIIGNNTGRK